MDRTKLLLSSDHSVPFFQNVISASKNGAGILGLVSLQIKSLQISEQIQARFLSDRMIYRQKEHLAKLKKSSPQSFALSFEPLQVLVLEIWLTKVRKTRTMVGLGT
jgi:hypothetical protein